MPPVYATKPNVAAISDQRSQVELRMVRKPSCISRTIPRGPLADVVAGLWTERGNERSARSEQTETTKVSPSKAKAANADPLASAIKPAPSSGPRKFPNCELSSVRAFAEER